MRFAYIVKAENTLGKYRYVFKLLGFNTLQHKTSKVNEAFYATSMAHDTSGADNPCHLSLVISVLEGARSYRITSEIYQ